MNVYFEINPNVDLSEFNNHRYYALHDTRTSAVIGGAFRGMLVNSDRVWVEEEGKIHYLKHRHSLPQDTLVDMKEFFWIKLKSIVL